ncbi:MAG: hypothetical protein ACOYJG_12475 [Prevotella sp.]|jgi:anti-anti-sigma regulatory factor
MEKVIKLAELLSKDIRSRRNANAIRKELSGIDSGKVIIDMTDVGFISRSFADELLNIISENKQYDISLENMCEEVKTMISLVETGRKSKRTRPTNNSSFIELKDMDSVRNFFSLL